MRWQRLQESLRTTRLRADGLAAGGEKRLGAMDTVSLRASLIRCSVHSVIRRC